MKKHAKFLSLIFMAATILLPLSAKDTTDYFTLAKEGTLEQIKQAFRSNWNLKNQVFGENRESLLMLCLKEDRPIEIINYILEEEVSVTATAKDKRTPIMFAAQYTSDTKILDLVINFDIVLGIGRNGRLKAKDKLGHTAYYYARLNEKCDTYSLLTGYMKDPYPNDIPEQTVSTTESESETEKATVVATFKPETPAEKEETPEETPASPTAEVIATYVPPTPTPAQTPVTQTETTVAQTEVEATYKAPEPQVSQNTNSEVTATYKAPETVQPQVSEVAAEYQAPQITVQPILEETPVTEQPQQLPSIQITQTQTVQPKEEPSVPQTQPQSEPQETAPQVIPQSQPPVQDIFTVPPAVQQPVVPKTNVNPVDQTYLFDYAISTERFPEKTEIQTQIAIANPNEADENGVTLLMKAAKAGNDWDVEQLIKNGADVNLRDKDGWSALMYAVRYQNSVNIVKTLIANGAHVRVRNIYNATPLLLAADYSQNPEILKILLENRSPAENEVYNAFVLCLTSNSSSSHIILTKLQLFLNMNISINRVWKGKTPLMYACQYGSSTQVIKLLLDYGAKTSIQDSTGKNAFDYAKENTKLTHDDIYWSLNN